MSSRPFSRLSRTSTRSGSRAGTPMINAESAERFVKDAVFRYWKEMQKQCRDWDVDNSGCISTSQFGDLLNQYGVLLPPDDFNDLVTKYDINETGQFNYSEFIRNFLLNIKPSEQRGLTNREKQPSKKLYHPNGSIHGNDPFSDAASRTRDCVNQHWKEMRREFRNVDQENHGSVLSDEFRKILRQFSINLSEDEFQMLQDKYDKKNSDWIDYNNFLKDYLH